MLSSCGHQKEGKKVDLGEGPLYSVTPLCVPRQTCLLIPSAHPPPESSCCVPLGSLVLSTLAHHFTHFHCLLCFSHPFSASLSFFLQEVFLIISAVGALMIEA